MRDILGYEGKRCVVIGAATGMGDACARTLVEMGAEVIAMDIAPVTAPVKETIEVNLMDEASIDRAVAELPGEIGVVLMCAGVPGPPRFDALQTMLVNFVGLRHCLDALIPKVKSPGGSIALITSVAGMGYKKNLEKLHELIGTPSFDAAKAWCEANPDIANGYLGAKQALIVWTKTRASELVEREIRLNCLSPAPTATPMLPDFHAQAGKEFLTEHFQAPIGRDATPEEMAEPLILLASDASRFVSGHNLVVDYGYSGQVDVGLRPALLGQ